MNKKVFIKTYGCQMNVADSELVSTILQNSGFEICADIDIADVIIFNTCSVRQHAEERALGRIANELSRKNDNPNLKVGVIGCMAQRIGERLVKENKGADFYIGVDQYRNIARTIENSFDNTAPITALGMDTDEVYENIVPAHRGKFNAFITIMRGCNNFCSYCIVPYTRGRERSRPLEEILNDVELAGRKGFKDVTLLGQNVNSYHYNNVTFADLLKKANSIDSIRRIRFITSHPKDLSDNVIETMASSDKICPHLHLPLQSADDDILSKMNRGYTYDHYLNIINKLRKLIPNMALTTDIIVGFPTESEAQYQKTVEALKAIRFDYAFTFKFSPREGTQAANIEGQIHESVRLTRLQEIIKVQEHITLQKYREKIGSIVEVYVESISKKSANELSGKSEDFKITVFEGEPSLIGKFVKVKITDAVGWTLRGKLIE